MIIVYAIGVLGILGAIFGVVLAVASKVFAVETDERLEPMIEALPGANCGGCGYSGCAAYAQAVIEGKAKIGLCASGGNESAQAMAKIMGVEAEAVERKVAMVMCRGLNVKHKGEYDGIQDCIAASKVAGKGPLACEFGCLGYGTCLKACKYGALSLKNGRAHIDADKCVGCMSCVEVCPRHVIAPVPYEADIVVACNSHAKGGTVSKACDIGCLGCGKCEKTCPNDAIKVTNNLARIDYSKCVSCGLCAEVCPRHLIADANLRQDQDLVPAKAR